MGAWTDLALADATLQGIAVVDLTDPDDSTFDDTRATTAYVSASKRYIETRLIGTIPELVAKSDGPDAFMDVVVGISNVASILQEILGWAFLIHYYRQEMLGIGDQFGANETNAKMRFEDAYTALVAYLKADDDFIDALEAANDKTYGAFDDPIFVG